MTAVQQDGGQIAAQGNNRLLVWNLNDGKLKAEIAPAPDGQSLQFVSTGEVLLDGRLYELVSKSSVCRFMFQSPAHAWHLVKGIADGKPWVLLAPRTTARASLVKVGLLIQVGGTSKIEEIVGFQVLPEQPEKLVAGSDFVEVSWRCPRIVGQLDLRRRSGAGRAAALVPRRRSQRRSAGGGAWA